MTRKLMVAYVSYMNHVKFRFMGYDFKVMNHRLMPTYVPQLMDLNIRVPTYETPIF